MKPGTSYPGPGKHHWTLCVFTRFSRQSLHVVVTEDTAVTAPEVVPYTSHTTVSKTNSNSGPSTWMSLVCTCVESHSFSSLPLIYHILLCLPQRT